jgi:hypothetical protein
MEVFVAIGAASEAGGEVEAAPWVVSREEGDNGECGGLIVMSGEGVRDSNTSFIGTSKDEAGTVCEAGGEVEEVALLTCSKDGGLGSSSSVLQSSAIVSVSRGISYSGSLPSFPTFSSRPWAFGGLKV